jgi:hypothetical protein
MMMMKQNSSCMQLGAAVMDDADNSSQAFGYSPNSAAEASVTKEA